MAMGGSVGTYTGVSVVSMLTSGALGVWLKCLLSEEDFKEYAESAIYNIKELEEELEDPETYD
jgi:hypothetical protein